MRIDHALWFLWLAITGREEIVLKRSVDEILARRTEHLTIELANAREFLRNENRQINAQMNRVMKQNVELVRAFRAKMSRRSRRAMDVRRAYRQNAALVMEVGHLRNQLKEIIEGPDAS